MTHITADLGSYSHISVLKATIARSPCRKIPNESIRAPFSHPRLSVPGVGLDDTDVLVKYTAGIPAPPGAASATSPSWGSMLTPLTTSMGHRSWTKLNFKVGRGASHTDSRSSPVIVGQLIDMLRRTVFRERWWHPLPSKRTLILLQASIQP